MMTGVFFRLILQLHTIVGCCLRGKLLGYHILRLRKSTFINIHSKIHTFHLHNRFETNDPYFGLLPTSIDP